MARESARLHTRFRPAVLASCVLIFAASCGGGSTAARRHHLAPTVPTRRLVVVRVKTIAVSHDYQDLAWFGSDTLLGSDAAGVSDSSPSGNAAVFQLSVQTSHELLLRLPDQTDLSVSPARFGYVYAGPLTVL